MKIVLDSNVLIAALGTHGLCEELFELCVLNHELYVCEQIITEVKRNLMAKFRSTDAAVEFAITKIREACKVVEPSSVASDACRDPNDLMVLGTAMIAGAERIVTGDKDLLTISRFQNIEIDTPRATFELLKSIL